MVFIKPIAGARILLRAATPGRLKHRFPDIFDRYGAGNEFLIAPPFPYLRKRIFHPASSFRRAAEMNSAGQPGAVPAFGGQPSPAPNEHTRVALRTEPVGCHF